MNLCKLTFSNCNLINFISSDHILGNHPAAIEQIAIGEFLWGDGANETLASLRKDCQKMILIIKHHQRGSGSSRFETL